MFTHKVYCCSHKVITLHYWLYMEGDATLSYHKEQIQISLNHSKGGCGFEVTS